MSDDSILLELTELLKNDDGTIEDIPINQEQSLDMVLEEMEDAEKYASREKLVEADLFKFIDNPKLPTPTERMAMLDNLGDSLWYDKWQQGRCEQVADIDGADVVLARTRIFNPSLEASKQTLTEAFDKIETLQTENKKPWYDEVEEYAEKVEVEMSVEEYDEKFDVVPYEENLGETVTGPGDIELVETITSLEDHMAYYAIDETTQPISQASLDMLDGAVQSGDAVAWDLMPTVAEIVDMSAGLAVQAAGFLAVYGLVEGLTPIFKSLMDTDWIRTPWLTAQTKESIETVENQMTYMLGPNYKLIENVNKFLKKPFYVWYFDSVDARVKDTESFQSPTLVWNGVKHTPCTNLWLRGRVVGMFGKSVGFSDSKYRLILAVKITSSKTDTTFDDATFWVDASSGVIVRDTGSIAKAAYTVNFAKELFR